MNVPVCKNEIMHLSMRTGPIFDPCGMPMANK